ncbi:MULTISPECIES: glycerophosphodiester phosphodiesterase family protein [unclassified Mycoplasma]|uniref:glycerophosphodiester phosphodiesterase family protein n=1 Tax=unclassified Mycoplasma TaxID=2683645 RepID=UPI00211BFF32|nr:MULTISPECIES: glycerophosphodiester phosphodiesterase family protein [unclassified Mycoplasma]UUM19597.1 glycerophosphodiester phosphodiesterase [Mycoplasma sp. 1578d]UUM24517.1 glycerophosphodiester phosphodiesterase [Mycoplasma sp. 3686d]
MTRKKQLLLAHRGYSGIAPENTRMAFTLAYEYGFDGVELDVHMTKDKRLVIIHDETTERTALVKKDIEKSTLEQLKKHNHASFFHFDVPKQTILTLEEFFEEFLDKFKVINVEIKTDVKIYPGIEEKLDELKNVYPQIFDKVVYSSFNFQTLERMYELDSRYKLAFLWWKKTEFKKISSQRIKRVCQYLNPWTNLYDKYKDEYKKLGLPFMLWTLKTDKKYKEYLQDDQVAAQISNLKYKK